MFSRKHLQEAAWFSATTGPSSRLPASRTTARSYPNPVMPRRTGIPRQFPSTVLAALVANKVYPDPYYGNNYMELPGVRRWDKPEGNPFESSWWYRTEFDLPSDYAGKHVWLKFHSVNYRANLWVNGQKVADSTRWRAHTGCIPSISRNTRKPGKRIASRWRFFPPGLLTLPSPGLTGILLLPTGAWASGTT